VAENVDELVAQTGWKEKLQVYPEILASIIEAIVSSKNK